MAFQIPTHLTDPVVRDYDRLSPGEAWAIDRLTAEVEVRKLAWLSQHPVWVFKTTALVRCDDGSPMPAYDVTLEFHRPRTPEELASQTKEREAFEARRKEDFSRREEEQKALLQEVLASIAKR